MYSTILIAPYPGNGKQALCDICSAFRIPLWWFRSLFDPHPAPPWVNPVAQFYTSFTTIECGFIAKMNASNNVFVNVWADMNTFFCFAIEKWYELPSFPNPNKWGYSMVSLNNDVYITGEPRAWNKFLKNWGHDDKVLTFMTGGSRGPNTNTWSTTETWKYVTKEERWITVAPMIRSRTNHASTTLNGEIYVIGG